MLATIIILSYNQSHILKYALYSLSKQRTNNEYEIIIADDGSNTENISNIFNLISEYPNLNIYLTFQQDRGYNITKARNNAIRMSRGNLIITLDGDIIPDYDFVESHIKLHKENKNIIGYSDRKFKNFSELEVGGFDNMLSDSKFDINFVQEKKEKEYKITPPLEWRKAWGFNTSFIKHDYTVYDEGFSSWGLEDIEFSYNLVKKYSYRVLNTGNMPFHINEENEISYNPHITKSKEQLKKFLNNAVYLILKHKNDADEFIKAFTIPNIKNESNHVVDNSIPFFDLYLKNNYYKENLYIKATKLLKQIQSNL